MPDLYINIFEAVEPWAVPQTIRQFTNIDNAITNARLGFLGSKYAYTLHVCHIEPSWSVSKLRFDVQENAA